MGAARLFMASEIFAGYESGFWAPARPGGNQPSEILACYDSGFSAPTWPGGHHPADPEAGESVANYNSADGEPSRLRKSAMTNDLISA